MYFEPLLTELIVLMAMSLDPKISRQLGKGRAIVLVTYLQKRKKQLKTECMLLCINSFRIFSSENQEFFCLHREREREGGRERGRDGEREKEGEREKSLKCS
jgi:hypothetical protein